LITSPSAYPILLLLRVNYRFGVLRGIATPAGKISSLVDLLCRATSAEPYPSRLKEHVRNKTWNFWWEARYCRASHQKFQVLFNFQS